MKYTRIDALRYLCVKIEHGKIQQYRNPDLWEQYSEAALKRLLGRMNNESSETDYWEKAKTLAYECVFMKDCCIELHVESTIQDYMNKLDLDAIQRKLFLQISGQNKMIRVISEYEEILNRYVAAIICDMWDSFGGVVIRGSRQSCRRLENYLKQRREQVIPFDSDADRELSSYLGTCGYLSAEGGIIPQMYRLDTVLSSDVLQSLYAMKLIQNQKVITLIGRQSMTVYTRLKNIQQVMYSSRFAWTALNISCSMTIERVTAIIQEFEKKKKCCRYPHRSFCFSDMTSNTENRKLYCWGCGNSKIINSLADEIKDTIERILGRTMEWPLCGTELTGTAATGEKAFIWLSGLDESRWIVIGEVSL